jgi:hypothetical protein
MVSSPAASAIPKRPWYAPTTAKFLMVVVLLQVFLFLSDHYRWFGFNNRQGYTVLIAIAATALLLIVLLLYSLILRLFRVKSQFGLSTLLASVVVLAIPLGWLGREVDLARQQRDAASKVIARGDTVSYAYAPSDQASAQLLYAMAIQRRMGKVPQKGFHEQLAEFLESTLGKDFFDPVNSVSMRRPDDESLGSIRQLPHLQSLQMTDAAVSDAGMRNLRGLTELKSLEIMWDDAANFIGDDGVEPLRGLKQIEDLRLINVDVTDAGLAHICQLKRLKNLTIDCYRVTDSGLLQLAELEELKTLRLLGGKITADGVQKLKEALPQCRIVTMSYR